jgi:hypothetical protein
MLKHNQKKMQKKLQKLYEPEMDSKVQWADLTSEEVRKCHKLGEDFTIIHKEEVMILTPEQLKNEIVGKTDSGRGYELFAYIWKPTKKINEL